ncbi:MAG: alanine racemase [Candidatus Nanopelagicales bacterium]|nr:alanine racemase [Candidatus Nanopelagicales bacterium]
MSNSHTGNRAWAQVSGEAILRNYETLQAMAGVDAMAVVKADAYGHGVDFVAPLLRSHGVTWLGVALPCEAMALRAAGDTGKLLCWLSTPGDPELAECVAADVDLSVSSFRELLEIATAAREAKTCANIHVKIDTGLSRNGISPADLGALIGELTTLIEEGIIWVRGVWSHLASADHADLELSRKSVAAQRSVFVAALADFAAVGIEPEFVHLANTAGALWHPSSRFNLVRIGIGMYGLSPNAERAGSVQLGLIPAMTVVARVSSLKRVSVGAGVSYSHTWIAERETQLGLVPLGYADGIPRNASNRVGVSIGGKMVAQVGTIAMDQFVVDCTDVVTEVAAGTCVYLFGSGAHGEWTADQWALECGSIGYEIVTRLGVRIPRVHV